MTDPTDANAPLEPAKLEAAEREEDGLVRFGVSMPAPLVRELDAWRRRSGYTNRSEAVRDLVRDALVEARWSEESDPEADVAGVVTIVYSHHTRRLSDHLIDLQHEGHGTALATLHIHLTHEHCLEVIVLRGKRDEVTHMADHLISAKGVLHGKFVATGTGDEAI